MFLMPSRDLSSSTNKILVLHSAYYFHFYPFRMAFATVSASEFPTRYSAHEPLQFSNDGTYSPQAVIECSLGESLSQSLWSPDRDVSEIVPRTLVTLAGTAQKHNLFLEI